STQRPAEDSPSPQQDDWGEGASWWPSRRDPALRVYRTRWLGASGPRHEYSTEADREARPPGGGETPQRWRSEAMQKSHPRPVWKQSPCRSRTATVFFMHINITKTHQNR